MFYLDGQCDSEPTHGETHRQVAVAHQLLSASAVNQESLRHDGVADEQMCYCKACMYIFILILRLCVI